VDANRFGGWLTLGANIGVVVGIIFLAIELRQNNELLRSQASITYVQARTNAIEIQLQNDKLFETLFRAREGAEISPLDMQRLSLYYRAVFAMWDWEYGQYADGLLYNEDQPPNERWRPIIEYYPYMSESWEVHKATYSVRFVEYMNENVLTLH
jgi:hypothetical protein